MAASTPTVSVVVTTCNRRERLPEVLEPLLADPGALEIIVVIDACHDGSFELVEKLAGEHPVLRPLMLTENVGQGRARMAGVRSSTGDVILSLDDDVIARPGLVSGHRRHHARGPGRVVLGYMPTPLPRARRAGQIGRIEYATSYEAHCREYERDPRTILTHFWGGNFSVGRDALLDAAGSVERLPPLYHEDKILGLSFLRARLDPVFDRALAADHRYERAFGAYLRDRERMGASHPALHAAFPELLGTYRYDAEITVVGSRTRPLVRLGDRPRARPLILALLRVAVAGTGWMHLFRLQSRLAW
ncbi:MAG: glycosyltransferase family 2 protein, partial [Solirubrobacterales bacterium]|nr:glycosyltransferase family 2 protein [Solirubrobacterales bacterium]